MNLSSIIIDNFSYPFKNSAYVYVDNSGYFQINVTSAAGGDYSQASFPTSSVVTVDYLNYRISNLTPGGGDGEITIDGVSIVAYQDTGSIHVDTGWLNTQIGSYLGTTSYATTEWIGQQGFLTDAATFDISKITSIGNAGKMLVVDDNGVVSVAGSSADGLVKLSDGVIVDYVDDSTFLTTASTVDLSQIDLTDATTDGQVLKVTVDGNNKSLGWGTVGGTTVSLTDVEAGKGTGNVNVGKLITVDSDGNLAVDTSNTYITTSNLTSYLTGDTAKSTITGLASSFLTGLGGDGTTLTKDSNGALTWSTGGETDTDTWYKYVAATDNSLTFGTQNKGSKSDATEQSTTVSVNASWLSGHGETDNTTSGGYKAIYNVISSILNTEPSPTYKYGLKGDTLTLTPLYDGNDNITGYSYNINNSELSSAFTTGTGLTGSYDANEKKYKFSITDDLATTIAGWGFVATDPDTGELILSDPVYSADFDNIIFLSGSRVVNNKTKNYTHTLTGTVHGDNISIKVLPNKSGTSVVDGHVTIAVKPADAAGYLLSTISFIPEGLSEAVTSAVWRQNPGYITAADVASNIPTSYLTTGSSISVSQLDKTDAVQGQVVMFDGTNVTWGTVSPGETDTDTWYKYDQDTTDKSLTFGTQTKSSKGGTETSVTVKVNPDWISGQGADGYAVSGGLSTLMRGAISSVLSGADCNGSIVLTERKTTTAPIYVTGYNMYVPTTWFTTVASAGFTAVSTAINTALTSDNSALTSTFNTVINNSITSNDDVQKTITGLVHDYLTGVSSHDVTYTTLKIDTAGNISWQPDNGTGTTNHIYTWYEDSTSISGNKDQTSPTMGVIPSWISGSGNDGYNAVSTAINDALTANNSALTGNITSAVNGALGNDTVKSSITTIVNTALSNDTFGTVLSGKISSFLTGISTYDATSCTLKIGTDGSLSWSEVLGNADPLSTYLFVNTEWNGTGTPSNSSTDVTDPFINVTLKDSSDSYTKTGTVQIAGIDGVAVKGNSGKISASLAADASSVAAGSAALLKISKDSSNNASYTWEPVSSYMPGLDTGSINNGASSLLKVGKDSNGNVTYAWDPTSSYVSANINGMIPGVTMFLTGVKNGPSNTNPPTYDWQPLSSYIMDPGNIWGATETSAVLVASLYDTDPRNIMLNWEPWTGGGSINPLWLSGGGGDQTGYNAITAAIWKYLSGLEGAGSGLVLKYVIDDTDLNNPVSSIMWATDKEGTGGTGTADTDSWYKYVDDGNKSLSFGTQNKATLTSPSKETSVGVSMDWLSGFYNKTGSSTASNHKPSGGYSAIVCGLLSTQLQNDSMTLTKKTGTINGTNNITTGYSYGVNTSWLSGGTTDKTGRDTITGVVSSFLTGLSNFASGKVLSANSSKQLVWNTATGGGGDDTQYDGGSGIVINGGAGKTSGAKNNTIDISTAFFTTTTSGGYKAISSFLTGMNGTGVLKKNSSNVLSWDTVSDNDHAYKYTSGTDRSLDFASNDGYEYSASQTANTVKVNPNWLSGQGGTNYAVSGGLSTLMRGALSSTLSGTDCNGSIVIAEKKSGSYVTGYNMYVPTTWFTTSTSAGYKAITTVLSASTRTGAITRKNSTIYLDYAKGEYLSGTASNGSYTSFNILVDPNLPVGRGLIARILVPANYTLTYASDPIIMNDTGSDKSYYLGFFRNDDDHVLFLGYKMINQTAAPSSQ